MDILAGACFVYALGLALVFGVRNTAWRNGLSRWLPSIALFLLLPIGPLVSPVARLALSTLLMIGLLKCAVALRRSHEELRGFHVLGLAIYFLAWPGLNMSAFHRRQMRALNTRDDDDKWRAQGLFRGAACFVFGVATIAAISWFAGTLPRAFVGWAMIVALLTTVHFGIGDVMPWAVRQIGFKANPLFLSPLRSDSLNDFWSRRWNLAFVEMDRILFLRPLRQSLGARGAIFGVFIISGLFHEMGISYPAGAGWGGPMLYFLGHGLLVTLVEPIIKNTLSRRILVWTAILLPLPLLFHEPFRESLILPLAFAISGLLHARPFDWYLHVALWLGCIAHFCILGASFQVPKQLNWHEDFASLSRFNRKIFWTYGAFIVGCIVSFGLLTGALHQELFRGDRAAIGLSFFIGAFWAARVLTDLFYFKDDDWPCGWQFEFGHVLLTFTFSCLAILYGIVVPWHAWWVRSQ